MEPTLHAVIEPHPETVDLTQSEPQPTTPVKKELPIAPLLEDFKEPPPPLKPVPITRQNAAIDPAPFECARKASCFPPPTLSVVSYLEVVQSLALAFALGVGTTLVLTTAFSRPEFE